MYDCLPMYQRIGQAAYKADIDNTVAFLKELNNPHLHFKSIHVAGTNGKGSVSHTLASILQERGLKVGLYTSPHLKDFRERIRINGQPVSQQFVVDFIEQYRSAIQEIGLSFFEMTVGMAFAYFAQEAVDVAVVEVGMGGRLDSTNVLTPQLSVITNIALDHVQFLGDTIAKIAAEKAGIIKTCVPVVIGETHPESKPVFLQKASDSQSPILFADEHYTCQHITTEYEDNRVWLHTDMLQNGKLRFSNLTSPLAGGYQLKNLCTILAACDQLKEEFGLTDKHIVDGIKNVIVNTSLMGRWQILQTNPLCICDTGHNVAGITYVVQQLQQTPHHILHFVISMVNDKDINGVLALLPKDAIYYFTKAQIPRGLNAELLAAQAAKHGLQGKVYNSIAEAFATAKLAAQKDDLVFVGGSTFTVAEVV